MAGAPPVAGGKLPGSGFRSVWQQRKSIYIAAECTARTGLHVPMDHVYVEILADGGQARLGEPGYLAVMDLDNLAMPFIRYCTEDIGSWSVSTCTCGRELPMLRALHGR